MRKRIRLCYLGAVLLASAVPAAAAAGKPGTAQSSTTTTKKKTTSKKNSKRTPKAIGQKAPTPDRIKEIQIALIREGALSGMPTGKWDSATTDAMRNYQSAQGLNPTGKIDALSLQKLGLGSEIAGKGAPIPTATPAPSQTLP
jgi:peptidoglycan hydrolase-like protein with peptidoglycan-binding domain